MTGRRLASGGRIDRERPIAFTFNGRPLTGYAGDTLASALLANGVRVTARSFKYHRPRGIVSAGIEEPGTWVELTGEDAGGNHAATMVPLRDGLAARSVNCWPSPGFDLGAIASAFAPLIPAGFYYKTFKWPGWGLYERSIRHAAGLAGAPHTPCLPGRFEARYWNCDLLIAGAGPAGLAAALSAGRAGKDVLLADEGTEAGGALLARRHTINGRPAADWLRETVAELAAMPNVRHLQSATVWGYREHNLVMVHQRMEGALSGRSWRVRAARVLIATGAIERMVAFPGNDRPGVMLSGAVQAYVNRWAVAPGRCAVVLTNNESAYGAAADMQAAGIEVAAVVDTRSEAPAAAAMLGSDVEVLAGHHVIGTAGRRGIAAVTVAPRDGAGARRIRCDLLAVSGGWSPTVHLFSQSRGRLRWDETLAAFLPDAPAQECACIGAARGAFTLAEALRDGFGESEGVPETGAEPPYRVEAHWPAARVGGKQFLDLMNDVTLGDVLLAVAEGYSSAEHVKRYTTGGMALDQGKTGNVNIIGAVAAARGVPIEEVGTTTFRAPYSPVEFGAIAGRREASVVLPYRHTPLTGWHVAQGAMMAEAGARWRRPLCYPQAGESFARTVAREVAAVREGAGIYDGSPLGKLEIKGPDAGRLVDMLYTNLMSTLAPGQGRYGLMLSEDGLVIDDGVLFRLGPERFLMSLSTGNAEATQRHVERFLNVDRPAWRVHVVPVTSQWGSATICGPRARDVLQELTDIDLAPGVFPFMALREARVAGFPVRIARVSFTGELSYEVNARPRHLPAVWERMMEAGAPLGVTPVGSEANHVLRVEKGFLSLGHEVDGTVDPYDLGMGWIMSRKKRDFIGKQSVELRRAASGPRRELVGLLPDDPETLIPEGAPLTAGGRREASEGLVTACVRSHAQGRSVALALLHDGRERLGQTVQARAKDRVIAARVTQPCFYDPEGHRLRS